MPENCIDSEAREKAAIAISMISSHEKHCSERWGQNFAELRGIHNELRWFLLATLGTLLSAVSFFVIRFVPFAG